MTPHHPIGILYAMSKEAAGLLSSAGEPDHIAGIPFYSLPSGHVLCVGGVGKVNAAMSTQLLIDRFDVSAVLNPGCAGCLRDLPVGTIVAGTHCVQHDVDTTLAGDSPGFVSTVEQVEFPCTGTTEAAALLNARGLACTSGVVATGDWFGQDYERAAGIRDRYDAMVCEMEACAAAQVCLRNGIPFLALKSVSDFLFSARQDMEYQKNFSAAMKALDAAVTACLEEWKR